MAKIVGIHGIAQQFTSGAQLRSVWRDAIRGGLEAADFRSAADSLTESDVRVAFFGSLFRPNGAMGGSGPAYTAEDIAPGMELNLLTLLYDAAIDTDPSLGPPPDAMGPVSRAKHMMLERLARSRTFAGVAERMFVGNLKQVTKYLTHPATRQQVLDRVHTQVDDSTRVMIGHSLGSVVLYEYVCLHNPPSLRLLVTLGSPLGIPNIVFDRLDPAPTGGLGAWPGTTPMWLNVADANDIVPLRKTLADLFPPRAGGEPVTDRLVDNGEEPHAADRYLNSKEVGQGIGTLL